MMLLVCLVATIVAANLLWLRQIDPFMVGVDSWDFLPQALHFLRYLQGMETAPFTGNVTPCSYHGPLLLTAAMPLPLLAGASHFAFAVTCTWFLIVYSLGVYALGRRLTGSAGGVIATVFAVAVPLSLIASRSFNMDFPLATTIVWFAYFLYQTDRQPRWWRATTAGIFAGSAMLAKGVAFIFILPLLAGWLVERLLRREAAWSVRRLVGYTLLILATAAAVCLPWYRDGFQQLYRDIFFHVDHFPQAYSRWHTATGQPVVWNYLLEAGPVTSLLGLGGLLALAWRRRPGSGMLLAWFFVPAIVFLSAPTNYSRFLVPSYAAMALAAADGLTVLCRSRRGVGALLTAVLVVGGAAQIASLHLPLRNGRLPLIANQQKFFFWRDWPDLQQTMENLPLTGKETMFIGRLTFSGWIEPNTAEYYLQLRWPRMRIFGINRNTMRYQNLFVDYCNDIAAADLLLFIADTGIESLTTDEVEAHLPPPLNDENSRRWHTQCRSSLAELTSRVSLIADLPEKEEMFSVRLRLYGRSRFIRTGTAAPFSPLPPTAAP